MLASCLDLEFISVWGGEGNPLSKPPGEYGRKAETQRNWRGGTQPEDHVV